VRTIGRQFNALKQGGLPQDVAELATFLASPNSSGISGANIRVCGHNLLGR
jgi:3-oxoacyl-[acyl-carrier protein] reductase